MIKKVYSLFFFIIGLSFAFISCLGNDDDDDTDYTWKERNEEIFNDLSSNSEYTKLYSQSDNGYIYWKRTYNIPDVEDNLRVTPNGTPEITDSIRCRYTGWYIDNNGERHVFASTEEPTFNSTVNPNKLEKGFIVSELIDGWITAALNMQEGDECEIVIPWWLGYGKNSTAAIPAFTTLWFNFKITKIVPMKENS